MVGDVRFRRSAGLALLALVMGGASCQQTKPTVIPQLITDTFTGSLAPSGVVAFPFTTVAEGRVTLTLTALDPLSSITVGIGVGFPTNGGCGIFELNNNVAVNSPVTDNDLPPAPYCVVVFDAGAVTQTVAFTITVDHY